nr:hypothetical protein [Tanacetum cinerariifolium]
VILGTSDETSSNDKISLSEDLINYLFARDVEWQLPKNTHEELPKQHYDPIKTVVEEPLPLDIVYPHSHVASSVMGTNRNGKAHYGLRSLGPPKGRDVSYVFQQCLNHVISEIDEPKWALFYCKPKKSLEKGLKLLHTDNDVHSFIDAATKNGSINLVKTKISKRMKTSMIHDEGDDRKKSLVTGGRKGNEKVIEDEGICSKGNKADVTIYKRAMVNGKAKMVEDVGAVKRKERGVVIEDDGFSNDGGKETAVTKRAIGSRKMEAKSVKVRRLIWWSLNDGVACLSAFIIWLINKIFCTHKVAKDLWERIQMLMQGTSLTKQERECKLYDAFDKFAYQKGETLLDFYLRFSLLLNDMNMYNMKLEQFQVNTKFLNTLPPEWSKCVPDASPYATSYHTPQFVSQGPSSSTHSISYPVTDTSSLVNHNAYLASSLASQIDYAPMAQQSSEYSPPKAGLVLRTSSNPRQQATIKNGRVTIQPIQGRQHFVSASLSRPFTSGPGGASGKQRVIVCYNCKGEGHMSKKCTKPKRKRDAKWFKDKVLLVQAQANGQERVLNELKHDEKASTSYESSQEIKSLKHTLSEHLKEKESLEQKITILKNDFQKEESQNIDRELALEKQVKEVNNIVFKRNQSAQTVHMLTKPQVFYNHSTRQALGFQNPCYLKKAQQLKPKLYDGQSRSKMIEKQKDPQMTEKKVITKPINYAILNQLSTDFETRFVPQIKLSAEQAFWSQYSVQTDEPNLSTTTTIVVVPKELPKVGMVNSCLKKLKSHLANFNMVVKERTTATAITEGTWGFKHTNACFRDDINPFVKALKELFTSFDQYLIDEVTKVQYVFKQMELAVKQHHEEKHNFQNKMEHGLQENDRLLTQALSVEIVNIVVHVNVMSDCLNVDVCAHCVTIESELKKDFIKKECYETLLQQYHTLEKHCISLEVNNQLKRENFQKNTLSSSESAPTFKEFFEINELKAQAQVKDIVILQLK